MKQITTTVFVMLIFTAFAGCGGDSDWWSGELEGSQTIMQESSSGGGSTVVVPARAGKVFFPAYATLRTGKDSPIPDCTIALAGGDANADEQISGFDRAFKGETNGGSPCEAFLSSGVPTKIEIYQGIAKRDKATGEITIKLNFRPLNAGAVYYAYEFRGRKSGWF